MKTLAAFMIVAAAWTVGCATQPIDETDESAGVDTQAAKRKPRNCSGTLGCAFAACYDGCLPNSNADYCREYCECRVYDKGSDMHCQMTNPYIDIKL
jgi:hypothetical protein